MCDTSDNEDHEDTVRSPRVVTSDTIVQYHSNHNSNEANTHPNGPTSTTRQNTSHETNHTTGTTTPRTRPQHQKHNEHILSARVWDTFSIQSGRNIPKPAPIRPKSAARPATNHVSYIRTKPNLYYITVSPPRVDIRYSKTGKESTSV